MRLFEVEEDPLQEAPKIVQLIKENCQPWLRKTYKKGMYPEFPYRGVSPSRLKDEIFSEKKVPRDRKPKDATLEMHNLFRYFIEDVAGKVASRHNSSFVTTKREFAKEFGKPMIAIPTGEFNYTWSNDAPDWTDNFSYELLGDYTELNIDKTADLLIENLGNIEVETWGVFQELMEYNSKDEIVQRIKEADFNDEIKLGFFKNLKYLEGVSSVEELFNTVIEIDKTKVNNTILGDDGTLINALDSRHEIMISSNSMYLLDPQFFDQYVIDKIYS